MPLRGEAILPAMWRTGTIGLVAAASVSVIVLGLTSRPGASSGAPESSRRSQLMAAYQPFLSDYVHPYYVLGLPFRPAERAAINNSICSLDALGFREPALARANGRKLAFLLGGSVAFGVFASSNDTTISSYLNRLQDEYFFVNAGMPGFTSTQELARLAVEIADHQPSLVVVLDGWTDLALARDAAIRDRGLPLNTPRGFPALQDRVEPRPWFERRDDRMATPSAPDDRIAASVARYRRNVERMAAIAPAIGAEFISVFQPIAGLHRRTPAEWRQPDPDLTRFHAQAVAQPRSFRLLDLGRVFDEHFSEVPVTEGEIDEATIFLDAEHFHDRGNEIVAAHIGALLEAKSTQ